MRIQKNSKRVLSGILALAMMLTLLVSGVYLQPGTAAATTETAADPNATGEFKLEIRHHITDKGRGLAATLDGGGRHYVVPLTYQEKSQTTEGTFTGIVADTYVLTVTGSGYLTYTQTIKIEDDAVTIKLYNDTQVNDGRAAGNRYGVIALGDVTGDGRIDDADAEAVQAQMGKNNALCDVNGNGTVDLVDLAYVVRNRNGNETAKPVHTASSRALKEVKATVPESTTATTTNGKPVAETIFSHDTDTAVQLTPKNSDQKISDSNPVEIAAEITKEGEESKVEAEAVTIAPPADSKNAMTAGTVNIEATELDTGKDVVITANVGGDKAGTKAQYHTMGIAYPRSAGAAKPAKDITVEKDGTVVIDLGDKVAIKRVSIKVTGTQSGNLAEIASVQFLGDFAERIPEPKLSIPTIDPKSVKNTQGEYKLLTFSWDAQTNVSGYEVSISGPGLNVVRTVAAADGTTYTFMSDSFNGDVDSFQEYELKVRSVSGSWRSDWSTPYNYEIQCTQAPPTPEYMNAQSMVKGLKISWRALYDTEKWDLYYRQKGTGAYTCVADITTNSYTIEDLTPGVDYEVYVVGVNRVGRSGNSQTVVGRPQNAEGVTLPMYGLINRSANNKKLTSDHITISGPKNGNNVAVLYRKDGTNVTGEKATAEDWLVIADGDPNTYLRINDWDSGVAYTNFRGPSITLDQQYRIGSLRIVPSETGPVQMRQVMLGYRGAQGKFHTGAERIRCDVYTKYDDQNRRYFEIILDEPITTDYIEVYTSNTYSECRVISIAEIGIYKQDALSDDIHALFTDETELVLRPEVNDATIQSLYTRLNTRDPETGELHPRYDVTKQLLDYAYTLLHEGVMDNPITLDPSVTRANDGHLGIAQTLSDNQPLGYVAAAKDTIVIYVSSDTEALGADTSLKLVVTQYHPEVSSWSKSDTRLKVGRNEVQLPSLTTTDKEKGGALYIEYSGSANAKTYTVRLKGAYQIPMLNVDGLTGTARRDAIDRYVKALEDYVPTISNLHTRYHSGGSEAVNYEYKETECFFNSTEIVMENIFFSFPASQVLEGLKTAATADTHEARVQALADAIEATEQEVKLFYQFKGLNESAADTDRYPNTRLNIRYHQMFTGAFMYAGGEHIGIEWGSVPGLVVTKPIETDANGQRTSGGYSGWGVAHEIGHCINAAGYQRVEVTNNIFAQLAQTDETNATFRAVTAAGEGGKSGPYTYEKVYKAVVAGNTGHTGDLGVQLGMYWQLHLAYDTGYSFKFYDSIEEQMANLFYARVDSYFRNTAKADKACEAKGYNDIKLSLGKNADQNFMRVCCAAAQKNLLSFFVAWGFTPDQDTLAYASQFPKEERLIQFIDDDSRLYTMQGGKGMSEGTTVTAEIPDAKNSRIEHTNQVRITLSNDNTNDNAMLGYEILRNGKLVAFVLASQKEYVDIVATENNQAFVYTVIGIDRTLKETAACVLDEVKVCHDGAIAKDGWTIETNMRSAEDQHIVAGDGYYVEDEYISAASRLMDNRADTVYTGTIIKETLNVSTGKKVNTNAKDAEIIINLGSVQQVAALKVTPGGENGIQDYTISVSTDGETWEVVKSGSLKGETEPQSLYFNKMQENGQPDPYMYIYDASFVKLTAVNQAAISLAELDILGPVSDNVELEPAGFGTLQSDFIYDEHEAPIPAGTIVFYGTYKGDPSYSVVLLKDKDGKILNGEQVILANVAKKGYLGETSDGSYIYWLVDADRKPLKTLPEGLTSVQAELYRVMDAKTLTGQRLTSTSLHIDTTGELHEVVITDSNVQATKPETQAARILAEEEVPLAATFAYPADDTANGLMRISAASQPVTFTYDHTTGLATVALYASDSPIAFHVSLELIGTLPANLQFVWDDADTSSVYRAHTLTPGANGTTVLDIYVVAHSGSLGSSSAPGETAHTKVVSGTLDLSACEGSGARLTARANGVDHVDATHAAVSHKADLLETIVFQSVQSVQGTCKHPETKPDARDATCSLTGYKNEICAICGATVTEEILPAKNHVFEHGKCTVCQIPEYIYLESSEKTFIYDGEAVTCPADFKVGGTYTSEKDAAVITITWHDCAANDEIGKQLTGAPKNAGTYWVKVTATKDGLTYEDKKQFVISPADYKFTDTPKGGDVNIGDPYPPDQNLTATGAGNESVQGNLKWYLDAAHTEAAPNTGTFRTGGTVTLYWVFTPLLDATNYSKEPTYGSAVFNVKGQTQPLEIIARDSMVYGETIQLHVEGGGGTGAITYAVTSGSGSGNAIVDSTGKLTATHVGTILVVAQQAASAGYPASVSRSVTITINKATPAGNVDYTPITEAGHTLADAALRQARAFAANGNTVAGSVSWVKGDRTAVEANTAYEWIFIPNDLDNYETVRGWLTPWMGGATDPGDDADDHDDDADVPVNTEEHTENGVTVKETMVKPEATVKQGVASVILGDAAGETIVQTAQRSGSTAVVIAPVVSKNADRVEISLTGKTVTALAGSTKADLRMETPAASVTLPNDLLDTLNPKIALTVAVEMDGGILSLEVSADGKPVSAPKEEIRLEIPVEDCKASTVAILLKEDGTREVIRTSLPDLDADQVICSVNGSARLLLADNHKTFSDVPSNIWYAEHVDFASSHELVNGDGQGNFLPMEYATRGAIATLLYNLEHNPAVGAPVFPDTTAKDWYTSAVTWAASVGVVNGYGNGTFAPNDNITREQMALILYNYANYKGMDTEAAADFAGFSDAGSISAWARNAMAWAVSNGLMQGSDGKLNPGGTATRAEVSTLLRNFCTLMAQ